MVDDTRSTQPDGRIRFWGIIEAFDGRVLRVVTLADGETVHNAFPDRNFPLASDPSEIAMKLNYARETDSLYIDLNARPGVDSREIQDGVVIDLDADGRIVGIDIQHASEVLDLATVETNSLPIATKRN